MRPRPPWSLSRRGAARDLAALAPLRSLAPLLLTGGWVRDQLLEWTDINPAASACWRQRRDLAGCPPGDMDLLLDGVSAADFHMVARRRKDLRKELSAPVVLLPARRSRPFGIVKMSVRGRELDITSLADRAELDGAPFDADLAEQLEASAAHRDATFNALFYDVDGGELLDPTRRGLEDLQRGVVRSPHPDGAQASVSEDPIRLLRCMRFAARFGFDLDADLLAVEDARLHGSERTLDEFKKGLLLHNRPSRCLRLLGASPAEPHRALLGAAGPALLESWASATDRVERLEQLILEGVARGILTSTSAIWRGRRWKRRKGLLVVETPPLLEDEWVGIGLGENDWVELLLAALLWDCDAASAERLRKPMRLSGPTVANVHALQAGARSAAAPALPGPRVLHAAAVSLEPPTAFWDDWPGAMPWRLGA